MNHDLDNPQLTSYALGELATDEARDVEQHLAECAECRAAVEQIRQLGAQLTDELHQEAAPALPLISRRAVTNTRQRPRRTRIRRWAAIGVAASLAGGAFYLPTLFNTDTSRVSHWIGGPVAMSPAEERPPEIITGPLDEPIKPSKDLSITVNKGAATDVKVEVGDVNVFKSNGQVLSRELPRETLGEAKAIADRNEREKRAQSTTPAVLNEPARTNAPSAAPTGGGYGNQNGTAGGGKNDGRFGDATKVTLDRVAGTVVMPTPASPPQEVGETLPALPTAIASTPASVVPTRPHSDDYRPNQPQPGLRPHDPTSNEDYARIVDNPFMNVAQQPLSTFSIDVDTAAYANMRRFITQGTRPPAGAVRVEELINYFPYDYAPPKDGKPFATHVAITNCPWNNAHQLVRVGLKGRVIEEGQRPPSNLVFLIDVSGSMSPPNKLPLLKQALKLLVNKLGENDRIAIVVYAGSSGEVLPSTSCYEKDKILAAIDNLHSGGSTNGASGIQLAYNVAVANFIPKGTNRVILATDGDFNVGITSQDALTTLIADKAKSNVFLSVLGFGMGNLKDGTLEKLANRGNGNYAYVDDLPEARKVLVDEMGGTLVTIAKDVKIQVEFNPAEVGSYRLIGYENRVLAARDFNDDKKDAGEIGAGHTVTALYEVVPASGDEPRGNDTPRPSVDPLRYQRPPVLNDRAEKGELLTLKLRYKEPEGDTSKLLEFPIQHKVQPFDTASVDVRFAAAVAGYGMLLRGSPHSGDLTFEHVGLIAADSRGDDKGGYRREFVELVRKAAQISGSR